MLKIYSKLEDNIFSGVTIKKGLNCIPDKVGKKLVLLDKVFKNFVEKGFIKIEVKDQSSTKANKASVQETPLDFNSMTQPELKSYVLKNNIQVPSFKKADILSVLMKG